MSASAWSKICVLLLGVLLGSSCTHWVVIRSSPPGAKAKIDGVPKGETPFFFEETTGWSKVYRLELEHEGYEPLAVTMEQDDLQLRYACPAVCLCPPTFGLSLSGCLFSYALPDEYEFVLVPLDSSPHPPGSGGLPVPDGGAADDGGTAPGNLPKKDEEPTVIPF